MEREMSEVQEKAAVRFDNYCQEAAALQQKLTNGDSAGKQAKRQFRLHDIQTRLLPEVVRLLS